MTDDKLLLYCLLCSKRFSILDVRAGDYVPETQICIISYREMAQDPASCFGKQYDETAVECREFCPDRSVCKEWNGHSD